MDLEERDRRARGTHERIHVRGADLGAVAWADAVGHCGRPLYALCERRTRG